jgi:putative FmdB family regulatory protein
VPLYEFRCKRCEDTFELLCRVGENGKKLECVSCGSRGARRLMSVFSARVKSGETTSAVAGGRSCHGCRSGNCASCH